jgi:RNA polymerase sigma factor (sigma-70 family)
MKENGSFARLIEPHLTSLYSYCLAMTCDPHRAEDLAQETLCRACESFDSLRNAEATAAWLRAIARRCRWNIFRKKKRDPLARRGNGEGSNPPDSLRDANPTPGEKLEQSELHQQVLTALRKVSLKKREVVVLRYYEELSYTDIALRLGISVDAVDQRLTRAKRDLRRIMMKMET